MVEQTWHEARLIPTSGINGAEEQERRATSALLAVMTAGAYGAAMSSTYNTRPLVPEILVKSNHYSIVRPRVEVEDLIALDRLPPWLE